MDEKNVLWHLDYPQLYLLHHVVSRCSNCSIHFPLLCLFRCWNCTSIHYLHTIVMFVLDVQIVRQYIFCTMLCLDVQIVQYIFCFLLLCLFRCWNCTSIHFCTLFLCTFRWLILLVSCTYTGMIITSFFLSCIFGLLG